MLRYLDHSAITYVYTTWFQWWFLWYSIQGYVLDHLSKKANCLSITARWPSGPRRQGKVTLSHNLTPSFLVS